MATTFRTRLRGDIAILVIDGDLDIAARVDLASALLDLEQRTSSALIVDVASVPFADCSGLRELERSRRRMAAAGRGFQVRRADPELVRVARLARYAELAEAMTSIILPPGPAKHAESARLRT